MDLKVNNRSVIVFDLDDTLYNEISYLRSAYKEIAIQLSGNEWKRLFAYMISLYRCQQDVFKEISHTFKVEKDWLLEKYREHKPSISPFPGVTELFQDIKKCGGEIGVLTDGRSITQRNKLEALGLLEYVDKIVISEEFGSEKPEPKNYEVFISPATETAWYIADNLKKDFITPKRLGWETVGLIDNGLNIHTDAYLFMDETRIPHAFVSSFEEIKVIY